MSNLAKKAFRDIGCAGNTIKALKFVWIKVVIAHPAEIPKCNLDAGRKCHIFYLLQFLLHFFQWSHFLVPVEKMTIIVMTNHFWTALPHKVEKSSLASSNKPPLTERILWTTASTVCLGGLFFKMCNLGGGGGAVLHKVTNIFRGVHWD